MKLVGRSIDKHGTGHATLRPEDSEDMWHLYNLISERDAVRAPAVRRVQTVSSTGSTESHRVRLNLTLQVSKVDFSCSGSGTGASNQGNTDADASATSSTASLTALHISGRVISENPHVKMGAFHTLDIETNRDIRIEKAEGWDSIALSRIEEAIVPGRGAEVGAVVCGEGVAAFCLLSQHLTLVTHRVSIPIPRKSASSGAAQHDKGLQKFYAALYDSFVRHIPYANTGLRAIVIASPGWVRDAVFDYIFTEAGKRGDKALQRALKEKCVRVHVNSPHVHSLVEVLKSAEVSSQLKETKFAREGMVLDRFFKMLGTDEMRAWYGPDHVCLAADRGAIGALLISDDLFRSSNPITRKRYVSLVEAVQQKGGDVVIFSSMHESGQQLNQLTGIAAILTFPLDVEMVEAEEREEAEARKRQEESETLLVTANIRMAKRELIPKETIDSAAKRARVSKTFTPIKVATAEAAAADRLRYFRLLETKKLGNPQQGESVVYWMRMTDLRIRDNRALSNASEQAKLQGVPLIAIFILSPQDYIAHDIGARRIDFTLRNLAVLKNSFSDMHIPLYITVLTPRRKIPSFVLSFCEDYGARSLFANIEYEVDEIRRDTELRELAISQGVQINLSHNKCLYEPVIFLCAGAHAEYHRHWISHLNSDLARFLGECPHPSSNDKDCRSSEKFAPLFDTPVPEKMEGFELEDNDKMKMREVWPEGEDVALKMLEAFLSTKARQSQIGATSPLAAGAERSDEQSRILRYYQDNDRLDCDSTSRLSVYVSSGVISVRECVRLPMQMFNLKKVEGGRRSGVGRWLQEIARRDFYTNTVACHPGVSMGRPFKEKYSKVVWENHQVPQESGSGRQGQAEDGEAVKRWKEGRTGVPIVDAAMRSINEMGWVHNRARTIAAMYLTKNLMIDWHVGERYFMQNLIDGDFATNNGGWQWCSSTGVDTAPYFRVFNPHVQSEKADPTGEFIRHWVPELSSLNGPDLHNPPASAARAIGYPLPIIGYNESRERVLRRFGKPGTV